MYFTKIDEKEYAIKPMNCPGAIIVYKSKPRSYRELPLKLGEFGLVHRHELSGVLHGLLRVRAFTQDDAHIFCEEDQIEEQIVEVIEIIDKMYSLFDLSYSAVLSTRPEDRMGDESLWDIAEDSLKRALEEIGLEYKIAPGEGAFYGPKIDFIVKDSLGREWQCGTVQLDFQMPLRFDLRYMGRDGTENHRPVMIHRVVYGSLERFIGILIEHYAGKFPLWLSPVQVKILTVSEKHIEKAKKIGKLLKNFRIEYDFRALSVPKKVREAELERVNYVIVIGDKDNEESLAIRDRSGNVKRIGLNQFIDEMNQEIKRELEKGGIEL